MAEAGVLGTWEVAQALEAAGTLAEARNSEVAHILAARGSERRTP